MEPTTSRCALPTENRLDLAVIREVGSVVGSYISRDSAHTFTEALQDALAAPLDPSQTLNTAVGLANAVALVALAAAGSESEAADVIRRTLSKIVPSGAMMRPRP